MDVFVLFATRPETGRETPIGVDENRDTLLELQDRAIDSLLLSAEFGQMTQTEVEQVIASMHIVPAKLSFSPVASNDL